jgi:hypothetical protein
MCQTPQSVILSVEMQLPQAGPVSGVKTKVRLSV